MYGYKPGDVCIVTHDIGTAFRSGDQVVIDRIEPDAEMPEFRYVVYSVADMVEYKLSDQDLMVQQPIMPQRVQIVHDPQEDSGSTVWKALAFFATGMLIVVLVLAGLYLFMWRNSDSDQIENVGSTSPSWTTPETTPRKVPETVPETTPDTAPVAPETGPGGQITPQELVPMMKM
ncbi:MAG: hypothetical protein JW738_05335 [Actinobacteria bacterium]|nr:hypothetical protein [Actinomycetota bacterium]